MQKHQEKNTMTTTNDLHREVQAWRNRALLAESRLATLEAHPITQEARN